MIRVMFEQQPNGYVKLFLDSEKPTSYSEVTKVILYGTYSALKHLLEEHMNSGCDNRDCQFETLVLNVLAVIQKETKVKSELKQIIKGRSKGILHD